MTTAPINTTGPQSSVSPAMAAYFQQNPAALNGTPQPISYTPPQPGGKTSSTPVVTSSAAQNDLTQKQNAFNTMQQNNSAQAQKVAQQKMTDDQNKSVQQQQSQAQANIDTQNKQKQQEIDAKNAALGLATAPTSPVQQSVPSYGDSVKDAQGNVIGQAKFDPNTGQPLTQPLTQAETTQNNLNTTTDTFTSGLKDINTAKENLTNQTVTQLNSILSGTFPLSVPQQALISSLQTQLQQNVASQMVANQAYTGTVTQAGFRQGGEYTPEQYAGQIASSVSYGISKIQALDNEAAKTMATLENDFQKQNYDIINKNYDLLNKQLDDKGDYLKDMYSAVSSTLKDQRDQINKEQDRQIEAQKTTYTQVTKPIQDIAEEMFKNGAPQSLVDQARNASTPGQALSIGGEYIGKLDRDQQDFSQNVQKQQLSISKANLAINQAELKMKQNNQNNEGTLNGQPQTATQSTANSYANRLNGADVILGNLGNEFTGKFSIGGSLPNVLQSSDRQAYEQAKSNFATAVLRRESGAAISQSEFDTLDKAYFPQAGDKKEVLDQKENLRNTVINNFYREANVARPVLPGMTIQSNGKTYTVGVDGETLTEKK